MTENGDRLKKWQKGHGNTTSKWSKKIPNREEGVETRETVGLSKRIS